MTLTAKVINLLDKLKVERFFVEEEKNVSIKFLSFNPKRLEKILDQVFTTNGKFYHMDELEKEIISELEYRNNLTH